MVDIPASTSHLAARDHIPSATRTLTAISTAHWVSHFHIFVLPMLFPFLKDRLGVGYIELGFALTTFAVVSGLTQAPIGYLVDRIGARKILILGVMLGGCALIALGLLLSYPALIVCAALLGLANSVYHPCDYAILSSIWMKRGWAARFRSIPLRASSAARSRLRSWLRWLPSSADPAH